MYFLYILQSGKDLCTYAGYTKNLRDRFREHNSGKVKTTRNRRPLKFVYLEKCVTEILAKERENYWKSGGGRRKLKTFFREGFPPIQKF